MRTLTTHPIRTRSGAVTVGWLVAGALVLVAVGGTVAGIARLGGHTSEPAGATASRSVADTVEAAASRPIAEASDSAGRAMPAGTSPTVYLVASPQEAQRLTVNLADTAAQVVVAASPEEVEQVMQNVNLANQDRLAQGQPPITLVDRRFP